RRRARADPAEHRPCRGAGLGPGVRALRRRGNSLRHGPIVMWIVKIGGSLNANPMLPAWLDLLAECGGGRVIVVCGGGTFGDEVRGAPGQWHFSDLSAHNMAILAMAQTAYLVHGLNPALQLTRTRSDISRVLHKGQTALWRPLELQRNRSTAQ